MGGFLRRLRRPKEEAAAEEPDDTPPLEEPEAPADSMDGSELSIPYRTDSEEGTPARPEPISPPPGASPPPVPEPALEMPPTAPPEPEAPDAPEGATSSTALAEPDLVVAAGPVPMEPFPTPALEPSAALELAAPPAVPAMELPAVPPPLPEADRDAATSSLTRHRSATKCFVCGSEMQTTYCPVCKMDWNE